MLEDTNLQLGNDPHQQFDRPLQQTDGHIVGGVEIDSNRFVGRMRAAQLFQVAIDPRRTEDLKELEGNTQLVNVWRIRKEVQRFFEGAKAKNVEPYARYIVNVHSGQNGMTPPIILYSEKKLLVKNELSGNGQIQIHQIQIPYDAQLVAIDGETQLAARFEAANIKQETRYDFVPVVICHGKELEWARQVFHDLNLLAVRPNIALGLSMDERDLMTQVARDIANQVPLLSGRVNFKRRQLGRRDKEIVTFAALRGACVTLAEGIGGVKYGAKPVPVQLERLESIRTAAHEWFRALADVVGPAMENRAKTVASSSSVMAALGALGHPLVEIQDGAERNSVCQRLIDQLGSVCWEKGKLWEGIAGKFTPKGNFSTSGAKDAAYSVYSALSDKTSSGYIQIRPHSSSSLVAS